MTNPLTTYQGLLGDRRREEAALTRRADRMSSARLATFAVGAVLSWGAVFGGWMSGWIYDMTGSYQMAFVNGVAWNLLNISIIAILLLRTRRTNAISA